MVKAGLKKGNVFRVNRSCCEPAGPTENLYPNKPSPPPLPTLPPHRHRLNSYPLHHHPRINHEIIQCLCGPPSVFLSLDGPGVEETRSFQSVCGNHRGRNPQLILAKTLCFSALCSQTFPPSLHVHPFLGFHFYSLADLCRGKAVERRGHCVCRCRPQTRPGNNSHSVVWVVASRTLGHSSHVSIITTGR